MRFNIWNPADFSSALPFLTSAFALRWIARNYKFGCPLRVGPSFFPVFLPIVLVVICLLALLRSFAVPGEAIGGFAIKGLALITFGILHFVALMEGAGAAVAVSAIIFVSAYARANTVQRWWRPCVRSLTSFTVKYKQREA